jgi:hypothetical protein
MGAYSKWKESPEQYKTLTFEKAEDFYLQEQEKNNPEQQTQERFEDPQKTEPTIRNPEGKRLAMIARLKLGPLSTYDAERLVHRGQAVIHQLTNEGHRISLEPVDGVDHYVYRGFVANVKLSKDQQQAYYDSTHWKTIAAARKALDGYRCRQCHTTQDLETHHWRYNLFAESVQYDLMTFCRNCHQRIHRAIAGSGVHFPRYVDTATASKIEIEQL